MIMLPVWLFFFPFFFWSGAFESGWEFLTATWAFSAACCVPVLLKYIHGILMIWPASLFQRMSVNASTTTFIWVLLYKKPLSAGVPAWPLNLTWMDNISREMRRRNDGEEGSLETYKKWANFTFARSRIFHLLSDSRWNQYASRCKALRIDWQSDSFKGGLKKKKNGGPYLFGSSHHLFDMRYSNDGNLNVTFSFWAPGVFIGCFARRMDPNVQHGRRHHPGQLYTKTFLQLLINILCGHQSLARVRLCFRRVDRAPRLSWI